ncbi:MAG: hypothetical protein AMXMBFR84_00950 [Candidatus Hydrogenedentota bacterium]
MTSRIGLVLILALPAVWARSADGLLDVVITPNNGMPALVKPGESFSITSKSEATFAIQNDLGTYPVAVEWAPLPGGRFRGTATVPDAAAPGAYAITASTGDKSDTTVRSVYVLSEFPESYSVAHVSDTHVGSGRHPRPSEAIVQDVFNAVNATGAAFCLVTGDVTENGEVEQYQNFVKLLDTCTLPTFVVSGNHDRKALNYENFFGPDAYYFWFGNDGYLGFDTKDFIVADDLSPQVNLLYPYRRAIKPARWAIGFSHRYEADMGMNAQLTLFVDDPLDHFFFGHWHREARAHEKEVPWNAPGGAVPYTVTPAAINGAMRVFKVDANAITPEPTQKVAAIE